MAQPDEDLTSEEEEELQKLKAFYLRELSSTRESLEEAGVEDVDERLEALVEKLARAELAARRQTTRDK